ncbi:hypothetical protein EYF80_001169 [Liparis tanakae]|uniref:Uncharacterized protein n=1 Tax=Liparis tanakae TaxID=230148 RepID=A0A4Z2JEK2_9TELE|nr:hypothetical protein EYF80_001169 [Liparis tanakae]
MEGELCVVKEELLTRRAGGWGGRNEWTQRRVLPSGFEDPADRVLSTEAERSVTVQRTEKREREEKKTPHLPRLILGRGWWWGEEKLCADLRTRNNLQKEREKKKKRARHNISVSPPSLAHAGGDTQLFERS